MEGQRGLCLSPQEMWPTLVLTGLRDHFTQHSQHTLWVDDHRYEDIARLTPERAPSTCLVIGIHLGHHSFFQKVKGQDLKDIQLMGHLCFDWTIPSDHMLERERQEQAQCIVFPKEPRPWRVYMCKYKRTGQESFPSSHGACSSGGG